MRELPVVPGPTATEAKTCRRRPEDCQAAWAEPVAVPAVAAAVVEPEVRVVVVAAVAVEERPCLAAGIPMAVEAVAAAGVEESAAMGGPPAEEDPQGMAEWGAEPSAFWRTDGSVMTENVSQRGRPDLPVHRGSPGKTVLWDGVLEQEAVAVPAETIFWGLADAVGMAVPEATGRTVPVAGPAEMAAAGLAGP